MREREGREAEPTAGIIDAQSVRAAATVPAASRGYDGGKKVPGRKRHIVANRKLAASATRIAVSSESTLSLLVVRDVLPWLLTHANVIHQCGTANLDALRQHTASLPAELADRYYLTGFVGPELPDVLALADVVVSRSGAGTLAELTVLGKAAVFIPLATSAGNEQAHNARHLHDAGAAVALLGERQHPKIATTLLPCGCDLHEEADAGPAARGCARGRQSRRSRPQPGLQQVRRAPHHRGHHRCPRRRNGCSTTSHR
ncbi:glycosyltransferase [Streptomyces sp. UG1]|uniref:glycosyltransferase n=1 Tax=Streptomyces sp. UG1 TaxID=3417652 RepID=UPI003CEB8367